MGNHSNPDSIHGDWGERRCENSCYAVDAGEEFNLVIPRIIGSEDSNVLVQSGTIALQPGHTDDVLSRQRQVCKALHDTAAGAARGNQTPLLPPANRYSQNLLPTEYRAELYCNITHQQLPLHHHQPPTPPPFPPSATTHRFQQSSRPGACGGDWGSGQGSSGAESC